MGGKPLMERELSKKELARLFILLAQLQDSGLLEFWMQEVRRIESDRPHLSSRRSPKRDNYKRNDFIQYIKRKLA